MKIAHPGLLYGTLNNTVQLINLPICYQNHGLQDFDKALIGHNKFLNVLHICLNVLHICQEMHAEFAIIGESLSS